MNQDLYDKISETINKKPKKEELLSLLKKVKDEYKPFFEDSPICKIVSLDTASTISGWAYFEDGKLIESGEINLSKEKDTEIRVEEMVLRIFDVLNKYSPNIIVVEKNVVGRNVKVERMLGHIVGATKGWALDHYKEFVLLSPSEWRAAVKGTVACPNKRKEAKAWSVIRVRQIFQKNVSDNEADAILLGYAVVVKREKIEYINQSDIE